MFRILLPYIYQLAENLDPLSKLPQNSELKLQEIYVDLLVARSALSNFTSNSVFSNSIRSSRNLGDSLLNNLARLTNDLSKLEIAVHQFEIYQIKNAYEQYKTVLLAELGITPAFFVTAKGSHDTLRLLDEAETLFPSDLKAKVPESIFDVREAGKAIAYDMPTACGFHVFRATECVIRRYYALLTRHLPKTKHRSLGVYVYKIRQLKLGDEKILASIDQMTQLHRNPIIHPEINLSLDDALAILGISRSIVTAILPLIESTDNSVDK